MTTLDPHFCGPNGLRPLGDVLQRATVPVLQPLFSLLPCNWFCDPGLNKMYFLHLLRK